MIGQVRSRSRDSFSYSFSTSDNEHEYEYEKMEQTPCVTTQLRREFVLLRFNFSYSLSLWERGGVRALWLRLPLIAAKGRTPQKSNARRPL
jgi:hypothetical protein